MILCTAETYMSETLPAALRGPGLTLFPIFTLVGQLAGSIVIQTALSIPGAGSYKVCFASQWPFTALAILVAILLPESPPWLVRMQKLDLAFKSHRRLESSKTPRSSVEASFQDLQYAVMLEKKRANFQDVTFIQCFQGVDARRTGVVVLATLLPNFFGLPLFGTASYFLQTIGMAVSTSVIFIIIGVVLGLLSNIAAFWTLTYVGRRKLLLVTTSMVIPLWASIGVAGFFGGSDVSTWYG